jgi:hypothetical protein
MTVSVLHIVIVAHTFPQMQAFVTRHFQYVRHKRDIEALFIWCSPHTPDHLYRLEGIRGGMWFACAEPDKALRQKLQEFGIHQVAFTEES